MIQISPMISTDCPQQQTSAYGRFFFACVCVVLILAIIAGSALCAASLAEIKRRQVAAPGTQEGGE
ncbi:hypothetical protein [Agrobacterium sp. M50-1]|uniref:hypothetical protein n=1 Tax=Agrobacterium sp. M50-1 TaxID=3132821 RepID=UPI003CE484BD